MTPSQRARTWLHALPSLQLHLDRAFETHHVVEYAHTLKSFFRQLLKRPTQEVQEVYFVRVPIGEGESMTIRELIVDMPRDGLFRALDLIIRFHGNLEAAMRHREEEESHTAS